MNSKSDAIRKNVAEIVLLVYFEHKIKLSTLWSLYSMLKNTNVKKNVNIVKFPKLIPQNKLNTVPKKSL